MEFERLNFFSLFLSIIAVVGLRVLMASLPNVEPIMLFTLSIALVFGPITGFIFGLGAMFISDFFIIAGPWTLYTSVSYGIVGLISGFLGIFKKSWNRKELTFLSFAMTIFYDFITATFFSFEFFIPLKAVLIAQIPFTLLHLSNSIFVFFFAPYLMKFYSETKDFSLMIFLREIKNFYIK